MDAKHDPATTHEVAESNGAREKGGVVNTLYPPGPKPGAGGRIKNHCRRFWWCDCLVLIVIVLVIVLPIIFVAIPKKAQNDINDSTLEVISQEVTKSTPDSIHLKLTTKATSDSAFHPTIEGFRAGLSLKDKEPFLYIDIPEVQSEKEFEINVEQDIKFPSIEAFSEYTKTAMGSESFDVYLDGRTTIHQKGLKGMDVDYNKVITLKGLNKLQGLNIYDLKILSGKGEVLEDGSNMVGTVYIPNPSIMTLELGNVTMNLAVDGKAVGTSLLPNLTLRPGNNTVPMQSHIEQLTLVSLITSKYKNGIIPLEITGNSSVNSEGKHLEYYEAAIQENLIKVDLDTVPALKGIGINITELI